MAQISRATVNAMTEALEQLSEASQELIRAQLTGLTYTDRRNLFEQLIYLLRPIFAASTDEAAALAAQFYDFCREEALGQSWAALPENTFDDRRWQGKVGRETYKAIKQEGLDSLIKSMQGLLDQEVKDAANGCLDTNAGYDKRKVRFARVPAGNDTCRWCIMLASRGFVYRSKESAELFGHSHSHCHCRVVPGWSGTSIEGYEPKKYLKIWEEMQMDYEEAQENRRLLKDLRAHPEKYPEGTEEQLKRNLELLKGSNYRYRSVVDDPAVDNEPETE